MTRPSIQDRILKANAQNAERESQEHKRIQKALELRREADELKEWKERFKYDMALTAFQIVQLLEEQRDNNLPNRPESDWNSAFCEAIELLPKARRFAEDCWFDCVEVKE